MPLHSALEVGDLVQVDNHSGWHGVVAVNNYNFFYVLAPHTVTKFGKQHTEMQRTYYLRSELTRIRRKVPE